MRRCWLLLVSVALLAACTKLNLAGSGALPTPTPSGSPTSGPTPGACGTPSSSANTVLVAMGNLIGPASIPPYGTINGYSVVENGQFPSQATLINQWLSPTGVAPITNKNLLQFVNVDTANANHSAVGFKGSGFPPAPYAFPSPAASPVGSTVSTTALWSTGRVTAPTGSQVCYSQTFTLSRGTYYFGDLDYYNLSNVRDVLIVVTPSPFR